jgi:hypothetical protein
VPRDEEVPVVWATEFLVLVLELGNARERGRLRARSETEGGLGGLMHPMKMCDASMYAHSRVTPRRPWQDTQLSALHCTRPL